MSDSDESGRKGCDPAASDCYTPRTDPEIQLHDTQDLVEPTRDELEHRWAADVQEAMEQEFEAIVGLDPLID